MKKKKRYIIFVALLFVSMVFLWKTIQANQGYTIIFLPAYGDINYPIYQSDGISLSLYCAVRNDQSDEYSMFMEECQKEQAITFDGSEVSIDNVHFSRLLSSGEYSLYSITMSLHPNKGVISGSELNISEITLNQSSYPIGNLKLTFVEQIDKVGALKLLSRSLESVSDQISVFHAEILNQTMTPVLVDAIELKSYSFADIWWRNENSEVTGSDILFEGSSDYELLIDFSKSITEDFFIYYLSPIIYYNTDSSAPDFIALGHYTTGLPRSTGQFIKIMESLGD